MRSVKFFSALIVLAISHPAYSASMEEEFMYAFANAAATSFGDFTAPGMDEPWRWFAEVTPGTGRLVVEVFDPDISGNHDFRIGLVDTDTVWRVIDPNGVTQATLTVTNGICAGCDNTFVQLANIVDPATGHWAIELDQTSAVTTGNDINTFLMRVHDGNALAGGTEINVYAEHQQDFSIIVDANVDHQYHPYITGHCQFSGNDFSLDQNTTGDAEFTYTSSTGFTTSYNTVSNTNTWLGHTITGFTSDQDATGYGIFNVTGELTAPPGGGLQFNFGQYYLSDQLHAANVTPSAQPEANAWRLYWPTDPAVAGGVGNAPLKPSLEQLARYSSGQNPSQVGQLTRMVITLRVNNPTPHSINVSEVSALLPPGADTLFVQEEFVTQGATSVPAAGAASGNIRWRPGVVAAGATALLAYSIDVTPLNATPVPLTGNVSNSGTRMVFVDETANSAQAQATYDTKELCQLRMPVAQLVYAPISKMRAYKNKGKTQIAFRTDAEVGASFFRIEALRQRAITTLAKLAPKGQGVGADYVFSVADAEQGERFRIVEVENSGRENAGTWFTIGAPPEGALTHTKPREIAVKTRAYRGATNSFNAQGIGALMNAQELVQAKSVFSGLNAIEASRLASLFSLSPGELRADPHQLSFKARGAEVPTHFENDRYYFWNTIEKNAYSNEGVLKITRARGQAISIDPSRSESEAEMAFAVTQRFEQKNNMQSVLAESLNDVFYWQSIGTFAGSETNFTTPLFHSGDLEQGGSVQIEYIAAASGQNAADVFLNQKHLGTIEGETGEVASATFELAPEDIGARMLLSIRAKRISPEDESAFYIKALTLSHEAQTVSLLRRVFEGRALTDGKASIAEDVFALDVSDAHLPKLLAPETSNPQRVSLREGASFAMVPKELVPVAELSTRIPLGPPALDKEYLILAPRDFFEALTPLLNHRAQELSAALIDVEDVYDHYGQGRKSAEAIRRYLREAHLSGQTRYVLLAGKGTLDPQEILSQGFDRLPTPFEKGEGGLFASDRFFADTDDDGEIDLALGRLPFAQSDEVEHWVRKVIAQEDALPRPPSAWVVADESEREFKESAQNVTRAAHDVLISALLEEPFDAQSAEAMFSEEPDVLMYIGHGSAQKFSADAAGFSASDVSSLPFIERAPIFVSMACLTARYEVAELSSMGETLLGQDERGALAFVGATGLSDMRHIRGFANAAMKALFEKGSMRLGDRLAKAKLYDNGFTLLGDPAHAMPSRQRPSPLEQGANVIPGLESTTVEYQAPQNPRVEDEARAPEQRNDRSQPFACSETKGGTFLFAFMSVLILLVRRQRARALGH